MTVYSLTQAQAALLNLLDRADAEGEVCIERGDGRQFLVRPIEVKRSALDVKGVDLGLSRQEIVDAVRESRER